MINKQIIDYLLSNSGKLKDGETWFMIGAKFGITPPDEKRAKTDAQYSIKSIARKAQDIWQKYLESKNKLKLDKEIYEDGVLKWETFKNKPDDINPIDHEQYDVEKITTNPYGGAWFKLKKKENFYTEEHLERLKEILTKEIVPMEYSSPTISNNRALVMYGADKHIGALTKVDSIYKNKYNKEEIKRRLIDLTINELEKKYFLFAPFHSLYIMDLGDALDGFNQKTTGGLRGTSAHRLPQQLNNREQHDFYVEVHKELFDSIVDKQYAKNLYFIATSNSNHGGDFEYGAMRHLETYLNIKYPFINTYVSYKPLNHFIYGKHCIIFGHGKDDEDMRNGLPLTLNDKVEKVIADYIRVNKLEKYTVSFVTGDLHQSAETYGKNFRYKKVLSQYGSSKWMHTNFGSGSAGLSSEVFEKDTTKIYKDDEFFEIDNQSNTGIKF